MGASAKANVTTVQGRRLSRPEVEKPAAAEAGRAGGRRTTLRFDRVAALALVGFEGLYGVSGFLHRTGHEPADGVLLPAHLVHDLRQRGAVLALQHGDHLRRLAARARPHAFLGVGGLLGFGRLLSRSRLPGRRTLSGRTLVLRAANVGYGFDCF